VDLIRIANHFIQKNYVSCLACPEFLQSENLSIMLVCFGSQLRGEHPAFFANLPVLLAASKYFYLYSGTFNPETLCIFG